MFGFHLSKSMMLSFATIGAVLSLFTAATTFAAFTASDTETGSVTAGTVTINLDGDDLSGGTSLLFDAPALSCPSPMAPGNACTADVTVTNTGTVPVTLALAAGSPSLTVVDSVAPAGCAAGDWTVTAAGLAPSLTPGGSDTFTVVVTLLIGAVNGCQGETANVSLTVEATNS